MANEEHLSILKQGVTIWNQWRKDNPKIRPDLSGANLSDAKLIKADLIKADLIKADLSGADLSHAALSQANLFYAALSQANLSHATLFRANLSHATLFRANLSHAALSQANLRKADLNEADLSHAALSQANLFYAALSQANLRQANLNEADLSQANLSEANLNEADLFRADLFQANLSQAALSQANLRGANLSGANLSGANLNEADLGVANLNGANLSHANLTDIRIGRTVFCDVDLSEVKGLETIKHTSPSTIGIDTIYRSKGNISYKFLLDAGVPKDDISYLLSLAGKAIDFYSCFISYSTKDQDFAERLHADLQAKGVRCWYAPEDIQGGKKIHEQVDHAIRLHDKLLVVLSEHSMSSEWVKTEIYNARQQEVKENRRKLFPISLVGYDTVRQWQAFDADAGKDMAREVREYFVPDFTKWKDHDAYQKAFERLVHDLKAEAASKA